MTLSALDPDRLDLPPAWDGEPIEWGEWSDNRTTIPYHSKPEDLVCHKCGAFDEPLINFGRRRVDKHGVTLLHQYRDLVIFRCRDCRHDRVWDQRTDQWWDLDPSDYEDEGSVDPDTIGTLF